MHAYHSSINKKTYAWDPEGYSRHSSAQFEWAQELITKLNLRGSEIVLDIGCGDGRITAAISSYLPNGHVVGIDSSKEMILKARENRLAYRNVRFTQMNVLHMSFRNQFDIAFSNAALHWVNDHLRVLKNVEMSLKKRGRLIFQMGGKGNAEEIIAVVEKMIVRDPWQPFFEGFQFPYTFYSPEEYEPLVVQSGLEVGRIELLPKDMKQQGEEGLAGWIRTTWLPYIQRVPQHLRETFISQIAKGYLKTHGVDDQGYVHVRMIRLEVEATKP